MAPYAPTPIHTGYARAPNSTVRSINIAGSGDNPIPRKSQSRAVPKSAMAALRPHRPLDAPDPVPGVFPAVSARSTPFAISRKNHKKSALFPHPDRHGKSSSKPPGRSGPPPFGAPVLGRRWESCGTTWPGPWMVVGRALRASRMGRWGRLARRARPTTTPGDTTTAASSPKERPGSGGASGAGGLDRNRLRSIAIVSGRRQRFTCWMAL